MSDRLFMISLHMDPAKLVRYAHEHDINRQRDEDFGYATHAWLTAYFGQYSPKPFRLIEQKNGILRLLGNSSFEPLFKGFIHMLHLLCVLYWFMRLYSV